MPFIKCRKFHIDLVAQPFSTYDTITSLVHQVELLVMKALSLGLVKGHIDEVEQRIHMTWVQPRVLDLEQVCLWDSLY